MMAASADLTAVVESNGVAFELSVAPAAGVEAPKADEFAKYVEKMKRMVLGLTRAEAENLRDELLIVGGAGRGVRLDQLADHHPMSMSASTASAASRLAGQIRVRAFDPILNPAQRRR